MEDVDRLCRVCRSEMVVDRMLYNWMSICLYQFLRVILLLNSCFLIQTKFLKAESSPVFQDTAGEPLYKLFKALKHQVEKGPVDAKMKKAKYTLNDTGLLGDDVEYSVLVRAGPETVGFQPCLTL